MEILWKKSAGKKALAWSAHVFRRSASADGLDLQLQLQRGGELSIGVFREARGKNSAERKGYGAGSA